MDGLGPADTDDGGGQCWQELHSNWEERGGVDKWKQQLS